MIALNFDEICGLKSQETGESKSRSALSGLNFEDSCRFNPEKRPECMYCQVYNPACLVKCNAPACGKWFCNSQGKYLGESAHIGHHLERSKHREACLHKDNPRAGTLYKKSPHRETILECYNCGSRNVCRLVIVTIKAEDKGVLLCRDPCLEMQSVSTALKNMNGDVNQWCPLIDFYGCFSEWLVKVPSEQEQQRAYEISVLMVRKLEQLWKTNPDATMEDVEYHADPVGYQYYNGRQYRYVFASLIKLEADYVKMMKESLSKDNVTVRWDIGHNKKHIAYFFFPMKELRFVPGDELRLQYCRDVKGNKLCLVPGEELRLRHSGDADHPAWQSVGYVIKFTEHEEVTLEVRVRQGVPINVNHGFSVDFVWKGTRFDRMQDALKTFATDQTSVSGGIRRYVLGYRPDVETVCNALPSPIGAPGLPQLSACQVFAIISAVQKVLTLIEGPPDTMRTVTSAVIVYHMAQQNQGQVLVCSPHNERVDQLAGKISATGLKVVRLCASSREAVSSSVKRLTLHYKVHHLDKFGKSELHMLHQLKNEQGELSSADKQKYKALKRATEQDIFQGADVICCTCIGAGDPRLANFRFQQVLIDEPSHLTEPEFLVPLVHGANQVVLIGEHWAFGAGVMSVDARVCGFAISPSRRFQDTATQPIKLQMKQEEIGAHLPFTSSARPSTNNAAMGQEKANGRPSIGAANTQDVVIKNNAAMGQEKTSARPSTGAANTQDVVIKNNAAMGQEKNSARPSTGAANTQDVVIKNKAAMGQEKTGALPSTGAANTQDIVIKNKTATGQEKTSARPSTGVANTQDIEAVIEQEDINAHPFTGDTDIGCSTIITFTVARGKCKKIIGFSLSFLFFLFLYLIYYKWLLSKISTKSS